MTEYTTLGIDAGGTFTDFVLLSREKSKTTIRVHKVLSTPDAPDRAIMQGISELGLEENLQMGTLHIIHGSTVATNAVLEGKGVKTAFISNYGFRDMLTIGRQTRPALYQFDFAPQKPPVPREYCLETGGRLDAEGKIIQPLTEMELDTLCNRLEELNPQAVVINLLYSYIDDRFEIAIQQAIEAKGLDIFISRSSQILPEYKEYERGIATWLNASISPLVKRYLQNLQLSLGKSPLRIMQSTGETIVADQAANRAIDLLLSGPAGGLAAMSYLSKVTNCSKILSFDMGGTSTDVALIDGEIKITNEGSIGNYPIGVPMVDMHTIGAGGGSIAYVDAGGMLQVGPSSAGANPGPACYGNGGLDATVTDANLVLGRLQSDGAISGKVTLDSELARKAISPLAGKLSLSIEDTAMGIIDIANEHMARALRLISTNRGHDVKKFTIASFGGAGGLHVCALADAMGMKSALVPLNGGVLSAFGMLVAERGRQLSRTFRILIKELDEKLLATIFEELIESGSRQLSQDANEGGEIVSSQAADICYQGQSYTLTIPWSGRTRTEEIFHNEHKKRYGYRLNKNVEIINLRINLISKEALPAIPGYTACNNLKKILFRALIRGHEGKVNVYQRMALAEGEKIFGPAIVIEPSATTYIDAGWDACIDKHGNILLRRIQIDLRVPSGDA